jgi:hypothetical protein
MQVGWNNENNSFHIDEHKINNTGCETHKFSDSVLKKEIFTYRYLDSGDSRNLMMYQHKLLSLIFAINPFCFSFLTLLFPVHFSQYLLPKNTCSFLPDNNTRNLFFPLSSLLQFFIFLNEPCQLFISKELNHPVNPMVSESLVL